MIRQLTTSEKRRHRLPQVGLTLCLVLFLGACSDNDPDADTKPCVSLPAQPDGAMNAAAFVAERALDFTSGRTERISLTDCAKVDGAYPATGSDIRVTTDGESVYELGRFMLNSVTKYLPDDTSAPVFQYSVEDESPPQGEGANPYEIVFVSDTKAYLIRYDSPKVWIINPSAVNGDEFKIGELDLSAYDTTDNIPEASGAELVGDKLFVLMQRLDRVIAPPNFTVNRVGYVAVFDTVTNTEIPTGMGGADGLNGIPLGVMNPTSLQYSASDDLIYLAGKGNDFSEPEAGTDRFSGGIESIDPNDYVRKSILDDGTEMSNRGFIDDLLIVSDTQAYVVTSESFQNTTLLSMNPQTGMLSDNPVAELTAVDITTIALDTADRLWVGLGGAEPGFRLLNSADGTDLDAFIATTLVPINVVFIQSQEP